MALTPDTVSSKLATLNETQESITGIAHWVMFHKRYADEIVQIWLEALYESSSNKKLLLLYLLNEVVQQSRVKKISEYIDAVSPYVVNSVADAYASVPASIKTKIKYVFDVWCQRGIFSKEILLSLQERFNNAENSGHSNYYPVGPPEWAPYTRLMTQTSLYAKSAHSTKTVVDALYKSYLEKQSDYSELLDNYKKQLNKASESCKGNYQACIESRSTLITSLESLIEEQKKLLSEEEESLKSVESIISNIENKESTTATPALTDAGFGDESSTAGKHNVETTSPPSSSPNSDDAYSPQVDSYSPSINSVPYTSNIVENPSEDNLSPLPPPASGPYSQEEEETSLFKSQRKEENEEESKELPEDSDIYGKDSSPSSDDSSAAGLYGDS
ncbi:RNA polymerase II transcription termination factor [Schizosaccharomyces pombe]